MRSYSENIGEDDGLSSVLRLFGQLARRPQSSPGGDAHQNALAADDLPTGGERVFVLDPDDLVIDGAVQCLGDKVGPDALDLMGARRSAGEEGRGVRLYCRHLEGGILLL